MRNQELKNGNRASFGLYRKWIAWEAIFTQSGPSFFQTLKDRREGGRGKMVHRNHMDYVYLKFVKKVDDANVILFI